MDDQIKTLLNNLEFLEHKDKPGLFLKKLDERDACGKAGVTAYIDFRKTQRGRRLYTVKGIEGVIDNEEDVNTIPVLAYFKHERDKILPPENIPARRDENLPKKGKKLDVGNVTALAATYGISPELANLFFMRFDEGLYIKNPGLLYLANKKGYSRIEITDMEKNGEWAAECRIYPKVTPQIIEAIGKLDKDNQKEVIEFLTQPTNGRGRASKDNVKMTTMHKFLREMAQTRACNRALRNYTGYGGTSYEELPEGQTDKTLIEGA